MKATNFILSIVLILFIGAVFVFVGSEFYKMKPVEASESYPVIFIIDIEPMRVYQDIRKYCLHYAIDGVTYSAIFKNMETLNEFLNHLKELGGEL
jgi:hypothetical protein